MFRDVLTVTYRDMAALEEDDVQGSDYILEEASTEQLDELVKRWRSFVGWQEYERTKDAEAPFKSYRMFLDDAAGIEVVARSVEIRHPVSPAEQRARTS